MSSGESDFELSFFSSEGSDTDQGKKHELFIPSPVLLSGAEDIAVRPSQDKLAIGERIGR
jgi:hypothetical protein